jgi:adenine C2-methylase RlmN of 23S rRNA A2503 and tRNA A37
MFTKNKINLTHFDKKTFDNEIISLVEKPFRSRQIWSWIYSHGLKNFQDMSNISKQLREILEEKFFTEIGNELTDYVELTGFDLDKIVNYLMLN